jgi:hypothetical protein
MKQRNTGTAAGISSTAGDSQLGHPQVVFYAHIYTCVCMSKYVYLWIYIHIYIHIYIYIYVFLTYKYTHIYTYMHIWINSIAEDSRLEPPQVDFISKYICMSIDGYTYTWICIYLTYKYTHIYTYIYVYGINSIVEDSQLERPQVNFYLFFVHMSLTLVFMFTYWQVYVNKYLCISMNMYICIIYAYIYICIWNQLDCGGLTVRAPSGSHTYLYVCMYVLWT